MEFETKVEILYDFCDLYEYDPAYVDFFELHDLVPTIVLMLRAGWITLTDRGRDVLNDAWYEVCDLMGVDSYGDYSSLEEMEGF